MRLWDDLEPTFENLVRSCLTNKSCTDDSPALEWLTSELGKFPDGFKRNFAVSAVDVDTGEFDTFTQDNCSIEEAPAAALASSSIPGWFQPRPLKGKLYMDGGTVYNTDLTDGIRGCMDMGYEE